MIKKSKSGQTSLEIIIWSVIILLGFIATVAVIKKIFSP